MSEQEDGTRISVQIVDKRYTFSCTPEMADQLRDTAGQLDQRLRSIMRNEAYRGFSSERVSVYLALTLLNENNRMKSALRSLESTVRSIEDSVAAAEESIQPAESTDD